MTELPEFHAKPSPVFILQGAWCLVEVWPKKRTLVTKCTRKDAYRYANRLARRNRGRAVLFNPDGTILDTISFYAFML